VIFGQCGGGSRQSVGRVSLGAATRRACP
jgi:hypothetical protein